MTNGLYHLYESYFIFNRGIRGILSFYLFRFSMEFLQANSIAPLGYTVWVAPKKRTPGLIISVNRDDRDFKEVAPNIPI